MRVGILQSLDHISDRIGYLIKLPNADKAVNLECARAMARQNVLDDRNDELTGVIAPRPSLGEEVYDTLLARLISLSIPPSARLAVDALARELGISQTPIRAALIRLESEGLVVKRQNIGYSAAPLPSPQRFREIYDLRLLLEPAVAADATRRMTPAARCILHELDRDMAALKGDPAGYGKFAMLDARFHREMARQSGNQLFSEILDRLHIHMNLFRLRYHIAVTSEAIKEHRLILDAMEAADAEGAADSMRAHIRASRQRMEPFFSG